MSKIVVIGAGSIGGSVAESLASEHEVTVIDSDSDKLNRLRARIDARFLGGLADSPETLSRAGCDEADIILVVTNSDLSNLAISKMCQTLYDQDDIGTRIARIRNPSLAGNADLLDAFAVTIPYNPEDFIAASIAGAVENPGTSKMVECCEGAIKVVLADMAKDSPWIGRTLSELYAKKPDLEFEVCAIQRGGRFIDDDPTTKLEGGDDLLITSQSDDLLPVMRLLNGKEDTTSRVFVAGSSPIAVVLASKLERNFVVTMLEPDPKRCAMLAQSVGSTLVLEADPTDGGLLRSEDIEHSHYFCAVTESDEINIMSAMLAKQLGCAKAAVLANRNAFQEVLRNYGMDMVVSPSEITSEVLLRKLQTRSYFHIHQISETGTNISEFQVQPKSKIEGMVFSNISWPENVLPCALVRMGDENDANGRSSLRLRLRLTSQSKTRPKMFFPSEDVKVTAGDICLVYVRDKNSEALNTLADIPFNTF